MSLDAQRPAPEAWGRLGRLKIAGSRACATHLIALTGLARCRSREADA